MDARTVGKGAAWLVIAGNAAALAFMLYTDLRGEYHCYKTTVKIVPYIVAYLVNIGGIIGAIGVLRFRALGRRLLVACAALGVCNTVLNAVIDRRVCCLEAIETGSVLFCLGIILIFSSPRIRQVWK